MVSNKPKKMIANNKENINNASKLRALLNKLKAKKRVIIIVITRDKLNHIIR